MKGNITSGSLMKLHILGAGCPNPTAERYGSAFILAVGDDSIMIDCGPATTYKMALMGLKVLDIEHLFLTHHHFDHNADVPCFVLSRWDMDNGSNPSLKAYGPPPTEEFFRKLFEKGGAYYPDLKSRIDHSASHECHRARGGSLPRPGLSMDVRDVGPGAVTRTENWSASCATVHHVEPTLISMAYRFETKEGIVTFAGDCGDCQEIRDLATGSDCLVMACTHFGTMKPEITDVITGTPEVVSIANEAGVGSVVLTHASPNFLRPGQVEKAVGEVARGYDGSIYFPAELTTVEL